MNDKDNDKEYAMIIKPAYLRYKDIEILFLLNDWRKLASLSTSHTITSIFFPAVKLISALKYYIYVF